mmetsp:Transcript_17879/g.43983  ORF Transcript_17879/g.43983 Transcript_17879/m.43983 type:complete len:210 (-) Transcript_17879:767-1396(-)
MCMVPSHDGSYEHLTSGAVAPGAMAAAGGGCSASRCASSCSSALARVRPRSALSVQRMRSSVPRSPRNTTLRSSSRSMPSLPSTNVSTKFSIIVDTRAPVAFTLLTSSAALGSSRTTFGAPPAGLPLAITVAKSAERARQYDVRHASNSSRLMRDGSPGLRCWCSFLWFTLWYVALSSEMWPACSCVTWCRFTLRPSGPIGAMPWRMRS